MPIMIQCRCLDENENMQTMWLVSDNDMMIKDKNRKGLHSYLSEETAFNLAYSFSCFSNSIMHILVKKKFKCVFAQQINSNLREII